jgi:CheY-like chemotaxis protein
LMMPEMTGMDLYAELLRTHPELAAGIVFITGGAFTKEARQFLDQTANRCMEKPFDLSSIRAVIRDHAPR